MVTVPPVDTSISIVSAAWASVVAAVLIIKILPAVNSNFFNIIWFPLFLKGSARALQLSERFVRQGKRIAYPSWWFKPYNGESPGIDICIVFAEVLDFALCV